MTYQFVSERSRPAVRVGKPQDVYPLFKRYAAKTQEHFLVVTLDGAQQVIKVHLVCIGLLNRTLIHPREVFHRAIQDNCASIILAHNHPSGRLDPSPEDQEVTKRMKQAGELLGITVLDHLIISKTGFESFQALGLL